MEYGDDTEDKIAVLMGSPNNNGSSAHHAENFIRGAKEQDHTVKRINAAHVSVTLQRMYCLSVVWNSDSWTFEVLEAYYRMLVKYLNLEDCGKSNGFPLVTRAQYCAYFTVET